MRIAKSCANGITGVSASASANVALTVVALLEWWRVYTDMKHSPISVTITAVVAIGYAARIEMRSPAPSIPVRRSASQ